MKRQLGILMYQPRPRLQGGGLDSAVKPSLDRGIYTMQLLDGDAGGYALAEIYDASPNPQGDCQRLANISSRGSLTVSARQRTGGFVFGGNAPKRVLVRAVGPGLTAHGIQGALG